MGLIDLSLPGRISGEDVAKISKKVNPDVPIITLSGYSLGFPRYIPSDGHLGKPFTIGEFGEVIESYFRKIK